MISNEKELRDLIVLGERVSLECKKASKDVPKSVWETYSAFANTRGGYILLGVEEIKDNGMLFPEYKIVGVDDSVKLIKDFWSTINSDKVNVSVLSDEDVLPVDTSEGTVVVINVPRADYKRRPVYINGNPMKGTFKRNYEGDYHCAEDEIKAMFRDSSDNGNDGMLLEGYTMDDIDEQTLEGYRNAFRSRNPGHLWNNENNQNFLKNLGGYTHDRKTGEEGLTMAGLLMFGKGLPVRERFDNIRLDYLDKTHLVEGMRWSDRVTYDGRWENNLFNFFMLVINKLTSDLKRPFRLDGMQRDDDTPVHKAVREAVTNMIIHSDYNMNGILKVEKRDHCFYLSNPGNLRIAVSDIYDGGHSQARNPRIQNMMRMIGFGDNIGSGFPTILDAWNQENWRKPDLYEDDQMRTVDLKLWMISLLPEEATLFMREHLGSVYDNLVPDEQVIVCTTYLEKKVSNERLQSLFGKDTLQVAEMLNRLVDIGILQKNSNGRWTTYEINMTFDKSKALVDTLGTKLGTKSGPSWDQARQILSSCINPHGIIEIMAVFEFSNRSKFRKKYIEPLISHGWLSPTLPDKPNSPNQKYVTTDAGKKLLSQQ